ncbi:MAG: helix-hairpin-helix domain-containing protein [Planctomycetes bacterium]|nr:helix-hairpin-helix domain-containing protein [Planctomycetota bacterium]
MTARPDKFDFSWTQANLPAILFLCLAATGGAVWNLARPAVAMTDRIPVDPVRVAAAGQKVNPNTASSASLQRLPGIGPTRAQAIVDYRSARPAPAFRRESDLQAVRGIGPGIVRQISPFLTFDD